MIYLLKKTFLAVLMIFFASVSLYAHPHIIFRNSVQFVWEGEELDGAWLEWTFDDFFSADIIHGYDLDKNGKFSEKETANVYNNAFINLENYFYFTFIRQGDERKNPEKVENFSVSQKDGALKYKFYIDLSWCLPGGVNFAVYDYTFFCDILTEESNISFTYDSNKVQPEIEIAENKDYPVYYNPYGAVDDTTLYYEWKEGLETFYPREIKISYK